MNTAIIVTVVLSVITTLISIILLLALLGAKRELKRMDSIEKSVSEVKTNYLNRFEEVKELVSKANTGIAVIQNEIKNISK